MSTYFHKLLRLNRNCRLFEIKNACYSGVAGFQMAVHFVLSQASPGAKVLVIASDIARLMTVEGGASLTRDLSFFEPSSGAGAVAMIVSDEPFVFQVDIGANGYYGYEVMDSCRPVADCEAGDADLSLLSYLDCFEQSFLEYGKRVQSADFAKSFSYLAMHTPFGGLVQGAHRDMMRRLVKAQSQEIETDFELRVVPGLTHCQRVGNIMGGTAMLSLLSTIDNGEFRKPKRIGCFSYGSGCCSEFFSGVVPLGAKERVNALQIKGRLDKRYELSMDEYEALLAASRAVPVGTRNISLDTSFMSQARRAQGEQTFFLTGIKEFKREYEQLN